MKDATKTMKTVGMTLACLWLLAGVVSADIPDSVDFWAVQTEPASTANPIWTFLEGEGSYAPPEWQAWESVPFIPYSRLLVDNVADPNRVKHLWFQIHTNGPVTTNLFSVGVISSSDVDPLGDPTLVNDPDSDTGGMIATWEWELDPQPAEETLRFYFADGSAEAPIAVGNFVSGKSWGITQIEVATQCIPVPGSLLLCGIGLGFIGVVRRMRRK